jgi:hypothetical protein
VVILHVATVLLPGEMRLLADIVGLAQPISELVVEVSSERRTK